MLFLSKAGRFYTVGASGLLLNYFVSIFLFNSSLTNMGYIQATIGGIIVSNISNFLLNKVWTFEDRDFAVRKTLRQYGLFAESHPVVRGFNWECYSCCYNLGSAMNYH